MIRRAAPAVPATLALCLAAAGCGPSLASLMERGEFHKACAAVDEGDPRPVIDRLIRLADARILIAPMTPDQARQLAGISRPTPPTAPTWMAMLVSVELSPAPSPLVELSVDAPWLRAEGWGSRFASSAWDTHFLLTGERLAPPTSGPSLGDLARAAAHVALGDAVARGGSLGGRRSPERDMTDAESLRALLAPSCRATHEAWCRAVGLFEPRDERPARPAAIAFTLRYATADAASGAHCTLVEHVVVPLAPGADLPSRLSATFPARIVPLADLRARAKLSRMTGEDPFFEDGGVTGNLPLRR